MPIIKTEAVILRCNNYRETSKIITFYTRSHGKLKGIAKGVRSTKSKWGGALQSMAMLNIMFYYKENRTLHLVSGADHFMPLNSIYGDFEKMQFGYRMVELVNRTTEEYQENAEIFNLLAESMQLLDAATKNYVNVLFNFEFRLLNMLGFRVDLSELPGTNIENSFQNQYFYENRFAPGDVKSMKVLGEGNFNSFMNLNISKSQESAMEKFFENYLRNHISDAGYSNSKKVFNSGEMF
ncbi:MAG: DNA repair protein RecO [Ignavibacteria bacterium]